MANKYVALLLVCLVVVGGVEAKDIDQKRRECNSYCYKACMFPSAFCKWWCGGRCENPILWESLDDDVSRQFPVPTEKDYSAYSSAHSSGPTPTPSTTKNEM